MQRDFASADATKGHENRRMSAVALWKPSVPPLLGVSLIGSNRKNLYTSLLLSVRK